MKLSPKAELSALLNVKMETPNDIVPLDQYVLHKITAHLPMSTSGDLRLFVQDFFALCHSLTQPDGPWYESPDGSQTQRPAIHKTARLHLGAAEVRVFQGLGSTMRAQINMLTNDGAAVLWVSYLDVTPYEGETLLSNIAQNTVLLACVEGVRRLISMAGAVDLSNEASLLDNQSMFARLMCFRSAFLAAPSKNWSKQKTTDPAERPGYFKQTWGTRIEDAGHFALTIVEMRGGDREAWIYDALPGADHAFKSTREWRTNATRRDLFNEAFWHASGSLVAEVTGVDGRYVKGQDKFTLPID